MVSSTPSPNEGVIMKTLRFTAWCIAIAALLSAAGCSTNSVNLKYESDAQHSPVVSKSGIAVGEFKDARGEKDPHWFGAIRGGFGNPLKVLNADVPVSTVVANAFSDGLQERKALAKPPEAGYEIGGTIKRFDCDQYARREATIEMEVRVKRHSDASIVYFGTKSANIVSGPIITLAAGVFGSVEELRQVAERALRQLVDTVLDDPEFRQAVAKPL